MSYSQGDKTVIDLDILKQKYVHDSLPHHLWYMALDCKRRRDAFWHHYKRLRFRNNMLSIPLLIMTSLSGLTSVAQVGTVEADKGVYVPAGLPVAISIFSVSAAILTTLQRYFHYAERSEHCKSMAKNYARIAKRIENNLVLVESAAVKIEPSHFLKFMEDVQKDTESLLQQMEELPRELLKTSKRSYDSLMEDVKTSRKQMGCTTHIQEAVMNYTERDTPLTGSDVAEQVNELVASLKTTQDDIKNVEDKLASAIEEARPQEIIKAQLQLGNLKETLRKSLTRIEDLSKISN